MKNLDILIIFIKIFGIFIFTGFGFNLLFLPKKLKELSFFLSPIIGLILIIVSSGILSFGRVSLNIGSYVIVLISILLFFYALIFGVSMRIFLKHAISFSLIIGLTLFLFPFNNVDISNFQGFEFFREHTVIDTHTFNRTFLQNFMEIGLASPAIFMSIILRENIQTILQVLPGVYLTFFFLSVFFPAKILLKRNTKAYIILGFLYLLMWYQNFSTPLILFLTFVFFIFGLTYEHISSEAKVPLNLLLPTEYEVMMGLSLSAIASVFPYGFKVVAFSLVFLAIYMIMKKASSNLNRGKDINLFFAMCIKIIFITVLLNPVIIGLVLR
ncbi:hypothetical protein A3H80_03955 [Candidatus Roizmanbacteria bacterium RIFCSPLOWO2_02_FULL_37_19]|uniref:Uncharacterized protein n=1 Tax=Candidatus Roizmanbacteria bacterium RIFCSPHIGHO2_02_FULL_37_24 TaxID=1802037 RepID=A0A1F7GUT1_9BACT|nr:MAG: hypothetical protein A2862_01185 [Candidatus Roizmanbacteria bacterium RIFCSPHIGHO2_01_FULL_38_41]OGK22819.1 MAG: hypothetical protein A3C24_04340 [Candidatus Roizmanbacteria bacterium RIFCSPHIGHO2_02_FULL_37_24]OGK33389.1 MAG: hypothetical protein A3E10_01845 [Candidatus Roizmanbacteria bacterium RIFCSPHIGHO2_12_FULL_37_23]OGK44349.1 MAG: hypothetical protein A2956_03955 [Candidatus Roizmanbacteria bacterium RIFCSPLOWO2_01_FULL_37_57]OGK53663.1 MAG: hypothetical protein A3H80_03955 [Ca